MKHIYGNTSPEAAYIVADYPWGYRLRTTIRYWIETKPTHGQRFCRQTINPKTAKWCAPKYGTYSPILILYLDENDHVHVDGLSHGADEDRIKWFKNTHLNFLDDFQKDQLKRIIAHNNVMKDVTFSFENVTMLSEEERLRKALQGQQNEKNLMIAIRNEYHKVNL